MGERGWEHDGFEMVVGLEVHVELDTATKLFSAAPNRFGDEPNTNVTPVCLGLPGSLPVLNRRAVELAIRLGLALDCDIRPSIFARKHYFYPDMPKDYQVSQYDRPICADGHLALADGSVVGIERAHLEEDTGKTTHLGGGGRIHDAVGSLVDYNRAGVPLLEIVSRPDIGSPDQARAYVGELRAVLLATGASDARMEEGSMRIDANVSVRPVGDGGLRTRCEIKNLNSIRSLGRAVEHEARRHVALYADGDAPTQQTRHWDEAAGRTRALRSKEEAEDYRYFPEPDLVPLVPDEAWIERLRADLPPLPAARRARLAELTGRAPVDVAVVVERDHDGLVTAAADAGADPARALLLAEQHLGEGTGRLEPAAFAALVAMETGGRLTATQAKEVLAVLVAEGGDPAGVAAARGFEAAGAGEVDSVVDALVATHADEWGRYVAGDAKLAGFFIGKARDALGPRFDGRAVNAALRSRAG